MKKGLITYSIFAAMTAFAVMSCADDAEQYIDGGADGVFRLASDQEAYTRAASTTFKEGTSYQLYAIEGTDFSMNYLNNPAGSGAVEGKELSNNTIGGIPANKFNGRTLNFYGVTNSTATPVTISDNKGIPTSHIAYEANKPLTDVMWAKKENQTNKNSGTITLPFGHTLSKLNLYVMKSRDDYDSQKVILNEVSLKDYKEGYLDMSTGKFAFNSGDKRNQEVSVLSGATQEVTTTATPVTSAGVAVAPMIFPTRKATVKGDIEDHALQVTVKVTIGDKETIQTTQITSILAEDPQAPEVPFNFESNHEYDMVITVTGQSLVVTIVPRVYDWIPVEEIKPDPDVNGSMTIGGITWMDRNVGASSGDPLASDQDWENSRGYYYQFGRNIPFYIKTKVDKSGVTYAPTHGNWHDAESMPYPFIPGHMDDGPSNQSTADIAINPTESSKRFNFIYKTYWDSELKDISRTNWEKVNNHPCPKGWRIPTKDEFQLIIPGTDKAGDIPFRMHSGNTYIEKVSNDPVSGNSSVYVGVRENVYEQTTVGATNSIYALKRIGTDNAYFLRWHVERSSENEIPNENPNNPGKGDQRRHVLVISRYPATSESTLDEDNVSTAANWGNPVEQIRLPISGYIHLGKGRYGTVERPALIYSGCEAVYWTSTKIDNVSHTVRMKFAGNNNDAQIKMYPNENRNNGCLIRCVRDTQAN